MSDMLYIDWKCNQLPENFLDRWKMLYNAVKSPEILKFDYLKIWQIIGNDLESYENVKCMKMTKSSVLIDQKEKKNR